MGVSGDKVWRQADKTHWQNAIVTPKVIYIKDTMYKQ